MKRNTLIILLICSFYTLFSQDKVGKIVVKGKAKDDKIYLRWAADDMFVLEQGLKHGFVIHRQTILKNNTVQDYPLTVEIPGSPFLPRPLEQWESHIDDDYFAIAAQALYGESFDISYSSNPFMQAAQKEQNRNQRLGFLLFACDQNFETAEFSAVAWVDENVNKNEKYLYIIYVNDPSNSLHIDTGYCFIGPADAPGAPIMKEVLQAKFSEKQVLLKWDIRILKNFYSSYSVERSENGKEFYSITDKPLVLLENLNTSPKEMVFTDSLQQLGKTYYYRIKGKDAFGDFSEPSNVVRGEGIKTLETNPELRELRMNNGQLRLYWNFDPTEEKELAYFEVRSRTDRFGDDVVLETKIASKKREVVIPKPFQTSYMTIVAVGNDGTEKPSLPKLFQEEDNTPPDVPAGIKAVVDTHGVVTIQWKSNRENDLSGYRLFKANQPTAEFTQITFREHKDTVFYDTVSMNTSESVFYKVMAEDFRGNQSKLSIACEAKRPVMFAPTAPVIVNYRLDGQTLFLKWANSADKQVTATEILVQAAEYNVRYELSGNDGATLQSEPIKAPNWMNLCTIQKTGPYDSVTIPLSQTGKVSIAARSLSTTIAGADPHSEPHKTFFSELSNKVSLTVVPVSPPTPELYAKINREQKTVTLSWVIKANEPIERIQIIRSTNRGQAVTLKELSDKESHYIDHNLAEGVVYEYFIRIETKSGARSFSKKSRVMF